jgi:hypothetical protein
MRLSRELSHCPGKNAGQTCTRSLGALSQTALSMISRPPHRQPRTSYASIHRFNSNRGPALPFLTQWRLSSQPSETGVVYRSNTTGQIISHGLLKRLRRFAGDFGFWRCPQAGRVEEGNGQLQSSRAGDGMWL